LHLYLLTFCHHIIVLLLVPVDGIPDSGLSSFAVKINKLKLTFRCNHPNYAGTFLRPQ